MSGAYDGLTPREELELRKRHEEEATQRRNANMNEAIRDLYRRTKGIRAPSERSKLLDRRMVESVWSELRSKKFRATQEQVVERLSRLSPDLESLTVKTLQRGLKEWGVKWPPPWGP